MEFDDIKTNMSVEVSLKDGTRIRGNVTDVDHGWGARSVDIGQIRVYREDITSVQEVETLFIKGRFYTDKDGAVFFRTEDDKWLELTNSGTYSHRSNSWPTPPMSLVDTLIPNE